MKYIIGSRGSGVTTDLVMEAHLTNSAILTIYSKSKEVIEKRAKELGVEIPEVFTLMDLDKIRGKNIDNLIIDNFSLFVRELLWRRDFKEM